MKEKFYRKNTRNWQNLSWEWFSLHYLHLPHLLIISIELNPLFLEKLKEYLSYQHWLIMTLINIWRVRTMRLFVLLLSSVLHVYHVSCSSSVRLPRERLQQFHALNSDICHQHCYQWPAPPLLSRNKVALFYNSTCFQIYHFQFSACPPFINFIFCTCKRITFQNWTI